MTHWTKKPKPPRPHRLKPVILPLVGAAVMSIFIAAIYAPLGMNLIADCIMLGFGIFIVDAALARGRSEVQRPAREAMIADLQRLHMQVDRLLFVFLWETAARDDLGPMKAAAKRDGDVAEIMARRPLITSPAPMRTLGILTGPQLTWQQVIWLGLSPTALRLETLIARYMVVADATTLAALQSFESAVFTDVIQGRFAFDDDIILEVFWRSMIQSLAGLNDELSRLMIAEGREGLRPASYVDMAINFIEQGTRIGSPP